MAEEQIEGWFVQDGAIVLYGGNANYQTVDTIPLAEISATRLLRTVKWPTDAMICVAIGLVNIAVALVFAVEASASAFALGLLLIAIGVFMRLRTKPVYRIMAMRNGTEIEVAQGTDKARIEAARAGLDRLRTSQHRA
jgi:uncharacterized protein DUF6232